MVAEVVSQAHFLNRTEQSFSPLAPFCHGSAKHDSSDCRWSANDARAYDADNGDATPQCVTTTQVYERIFTIQ